MTLARQQVIRASGADGPGVLGALHWQTGQVPHALKGLDAQRCGPVVAAAARAANALLALLACSAVFSPEDERAGRIPDELARARKDLAEALAELDEVPATAAAMFPAAASACREWRARAVTRWVAGVAVSPRDFALRIRRRPAGRR
ncbi:hypothetical protein [Streptomyces sp. NPDC018000]|uniref:hypothetical protein n=1 Tax=Streptomyces sp. NPDC018000 TaxID=3365028 RepID=UPI003798DD54